jgi:hypothetical protein
MNSANSLVFGTVIDSGKMAVEGGLVSLETSGHFFNVTEVMENVAEGVQKIWPDFGVTSGLFNQSESKFLQSNLTCFETTIGTSGLKLVDKFALMVSETASEASVAFYEGMKTSFEEECRKNTGLSLLTLVIVFGSLIVGGALLVGCLSWKIVGSAQNPRHPSKPSTARAFTPRTTPSESIKLLADSEELALN